MTALTELSTKLDRQAPSDSVSSNKAAFEAVQQFRLTKGKCLLDVFLAAQPPQEKLPLRGADPAIVVQIQR